MTAPAMAQAVFVVAPAWGRGWRVTHVGAKESALFRARTDAVEFAHLLAQCERPSYVRVLASEASIEGEWMYEAPAGVQSADPIPEQSRAA